MNDLPRNMNLKAFDPHRKDFVCKHEADAVPPIDPEAEQWLQEGLALTSRLLWPDQRDYKKAVERWTLAAERQHWKAMLNLANAYAQGEGVPRDTERAVQIVEQAMKLGIPAAYDLMGTYHMEGRGVKGDASRAYAFWELAADQGSPSAMAYIGQHLLGGYDNPKTGMWSNRTVGVSMLECAVAQGNGKAAYELGTWISNVGIGGKPDHLRGLQLLHDGVKFGSAESAGYLFGAFDDGDALVGNIKDEGRSGRLRVLTDALRRNPDLRLPNLDKVLPLPPTPLPKWDGDKQTLIDAAKAVVPTPPQPAPSPASQRTGRAHIPEGHVLPEQPQQPVPAQYESTAAPRSGYWIARLMHPHSARHIAWNAAQVPLRYERGEPFAPSREGLEPADGRILFHYLGVPVADAPPSQADVHPKVAQGAARPACLPQPLRRWRGGGDPCPTSGIWAASVPADHPAAAVFNGWHRQAYVRQGQPFPDEAHLDIEPSQVTWIWWDQANHHWPSDVEHISLDGRAPST